MSNEFCWAMYDWYVVRITSSGGHVKVFSKFECGLERGHPARLSAEGANLCLPVHTTRAFEKASRNSPSLFFRFHREIVHEFRRDTSRFQPPAPDRCACREMEPALDKDSPSQPAAVRVEADSRCPADLPPS